VLAKLNFRQYTKLKPVGTIGTIEVTTKQQLLQLNRNSTLKLYPSWQKRGITAITESMHLSTSTYVLSGA